MRYGDTAWKVKVREVEDLKGSQIHPDTDLRGDLVSE